MSDDTTTTAIDRECSQCGGREWAQFYSTTYERDNAPDRTETHYECRECGTHGRVYDHGSTTVHTGGLRA